MSKEKKEIRWTTIKVPTELRDMIKSLSERYGTSEWRIILWAVSFFRDQIRKPSLKEDLPLIDKMSWYITKIGMSVGGFKENPSEENLDKLRRTCEQITKRYGIDTRGLIRASQDFFKNRNGKNIVDLKMELNALLKMVILDLMWKVITEDKKGLFTLPETTNKENK